MLPRSTPWLLLLATSCLSLAGCDRTSAGGDTHIAAATEDQPALGAKKLVRRACGSQEDSVSAAPLSPEARAAWRQAVRGMNDADYEQLEKVRRILKQQTHKDILALSVAAANANAQRPERPTLLGRVPLDNCYTQMPIPSAETLPAATLTESDDSHSYSDEHTGGHFGISHSGVLTHDGDGHPNYHTEYRGFFFGHPLNLGSADLVLIPPHLDGSEGAAAQGALQAAFFGIDALVNQRFDVTHAFDVQKDVTLIRLLVNMTYVDLDFSIFARVNIGAKAEAKVDLRHPGAWTVAAKPIFKVALLVDGGVTPAFAPGVISGELVANLDFVDLGKSGLFAQHVVGEDGHGHTYTWVEAAITTLSGSLFAEVGFRFWRAYWMVDYTIFSEPGFTLAKVLGEKPPVAAVQPVLGDQATVVE